MEGSDFTVALELLNGNYYRDFDENIPDRSDIFVHTPSRAVNTPGQPSRALFLAIVESSDLNANSMEPPYNLPMTRVRSPGTLPKDLYSAQGTTSKFETNVLVGRLSNLYQGDPLYESRQTGIQFSIYFQLFYCVIYIAISYYHHEYTTDTIR